VRRNRKADTERGQYSEEERRKEKLRFESGREEKTEYVDKSREEETVLYTVLVISDSSFSEINF
jgi:hypothetical protein